MNDKVINLNTEEKYFLEYIRLLSITKVPFNTDKFNAIPFNYNLVIKENLLQYNNYFVRVFHEKLNDKYSLSIYLKVRAIMNEKTYYNAYECWIYNKFYSIVKFMVKDGKHKNYELSNDINSVVKFLINIDFYKYIGGFIEEDIIPNL